MGDPGGVGPEVALRAVCTPAVSRACRPLLVGDIGCLRRKARQAGLPIRLSARLAIDGNDDRFPVVGVAGISGRAVPGRPSRQGGHIAGRAIEEAVWLAMSGRVEGLVTAPVSKESLALAGYGMVGHTEVLAGLTGTKKYAMMIVRGRLRVVFATTHQALAVVAAKITKRLLLDKLRLTSEYLDLYMGIADGRVGVVGLNPHCGEGGHVGREEQRVIEPAIRLAQGEGIRAEGPYPADSIFRPSFAREFDAILAMYHDQGMIPLKMQGHDNVVNITIGIPCLRTSPGHGTAFDIAGKHPASAKSMVRAITECARIAKRVRNARRIQRCQ